MPFLGSQAIPFHPKAKDAFQAGGRWPRALATWTPASLAHFSTNTGCAGSRGEGRERRLPQPSPSKCT